MFFIFTLNERILSYEKNYVIIDCFQYMLCDTIAVMRDGKIIEQGETFHILHSQQKTYTKRLIAAGTDIASYWSLQDEVS